MRLTLINLTDRKKAINCIWTILHLTVTVYPSYWELSGVQMGKPITQLWFKKKNNLRNNETTSHTEISHDTLPRLSSVFMSLLDWSCSVMSGALSSPKIMMTRLTFVLYSNCNRKTNENFCNSFQQGSSFDSEINPDYLRIRSAWIISLVNGKFNIWQREEN